MANYSTTSPWFLTNIKNESYLDVYENRPIQKDSNDLLFEITPQYTYRPDLLSFDLYGTPKLWWVFAVRNPDTLKDPVFDFTAGTEIFLPKKSTLSSSVGL
jgi:alpha-L-fucosidase